MVGIARNEILKACGGNVSLKGFGTELHTLIDDKGTGQTKRIPSINAGFYLGYNTKSLTTLLKDAPVN